MKPAISVITVCYNAKQDLERTIESVDLQSSSIFEHIIIDGESTDGTLALLKKLKRPGRHIVSEPDDGIYDAMMKGVFLASGAYVIFMNAGDEFDNASVLSETESWVHNEQYDFLYGDRIKLEANGESLRQAAGDLEELPYKEVIFHQALFTRTQLLRERPYNYSHYTLAADYEYVLDAKYRRKASFCRLPFTISKFQAGGRSRQLHIKANVEAMHAGLRFLPEPDSWLKNEFVIGFIMNNFPSILKEQIKRNTKSGEQLLCDVSDVGLKFQAKPLNGDLTKIANKLNRALDGSLETQYLQPNTDQVGGASIVASVVTINLNNLDGLRRTVDSVLSQDLAGIEYIVIDGLSSDGSQEFIRSNANAFSKIVIEKDCGIYDAMNKGVGIASGKYILFLNSGDIFANSSAMSILTSQAMAHNADLAYGHRTYIRIDGGQEHQLAKDIDTAFIRMPCGHQSMLYHTQILRELPFDTTYSLAGDYEQLLRMIKAGVKARLVDHTICVFESGGFSESGLLPYIETVHAFLKHRPQDISLKNNFYLRGLVNNIESMVN